MCSAIVNGVESGTIASQWIGHKEWVSLLNSFFRVMLSARALIKKLEQTYCMCTHSLSVPGSLFGSSWGFVCKKKKMHFIQVYIYVGAILVAIYCALRRKEKWKTKQDGIWMQWWKMMQWWYIHYAQNKLPIFTMLKINYKSLTYIKIYLAMGFFLILSCSGFKLIHWVDMQDDWPVISMRLNPRNTQLQRHKLVLLTHQGTNQPLLCVLRYYQPKYLDHTTMSGHQRNF